MPRGRGTVAGQRRHPVRQALAFAETTEDPVGVGGRWLDAPVGECLRDQVDGSQEVAAVPGRRGDEQRAVVLGKRWLNLSPTVFGYHEVWHAMTVGAGACHFALVAMIVR